MPHANVTITCGAAGHLVEVNAWADATDAVETALAGEDIVRPSPCRATSTDRATAMDAGPGRMLIETTRADLFEALSGAIPPDVGTVVELSDARMRIDVVGPDAETVLAKGLSFDLHPSAFPPGAVAWSTMHHVGVCVRRTDDGFALYPLRSFADALTASLRRST